MKLCLNTSTIRPQRLLEKIRLAARAGFDGVELWINDVYEFIGRGGEVRDVERALADHGLFVPCTIAMRQWAEASEIEYPSMLEEAKRRMELARRLGAPYIVATPSRAPCDPAQTSRRYRDLLRIGREVGIRPTMEYISFFASVAKLEDAWRIVEEAEAPDATLIVDSFHTWNSGSRAALLAEIPLERISHWHIDDAAPGKPAGTQTDSDRVMVGDGPIDLAADFAMLRAKGWDGTVSLELFNRELWAQDPADVLRVGIERMRELLGL